MPDPTPDPAASPAPLPAFAPAPSAAPSPGETAAPGSERAALAAERQQLATGRLALAAGRALQEACTRVAAHVDAGRVLPAGRAGVKALFVALASLPETPIALAGADGRPTRTPPAEVLETFLSGLTRRGPQMTELAGPGTTMVPPAPGMHPPAPGGGTDAGPVDPSGAA